MIPKDPVDNAIFVQGFLELYIQVNGLPVLESRDWFEHGSNGNMPSFLKQNNIFRRFN